MRKELTLPYRALRFGSAHRHQIEGVNILSHHGVVCLKSSDPSLSCKEGFVSVGWGRPTTGKISEPLTS